MKWVRKAFIKVLEVDQLSVEDFWGDERNIRFSQQKPLCRVFA